VATPLLNAPRLPVKLPATLLAPVGWRLVKPRVALAALVSRPKLLVLTPLRLTAVTVAAKAAPALMGPAVTPLKLKLAGTAMKLSVPVMLRPASAPEPV